MSKEECDHEERNDKVTWSSGECEETCTKCGATRVGYTAWGDWENE